jgi:hypothetical protein
MLEPKSEVATQIKQLQLACNNYTFVPKLHFGPGSEPWSKATLRGEAGAPRVNCLWGQLLKASSLHPWSVS